MKYQIYLNKETSEIIQKCAEKDGKKPATFIKQMLESLFRIAKAGALQMEKEKDLYGTGEQQSK